MADIRIRDRGTGQTFLGSTDSWQRLDPAVRANYDLIGPEAAPPPAAPEAAAPKPSMGLKDAAGVLMRNNAFTDLASMGRAATSPEAAKMAGQAVLPTAGAMAGAATGPLAPVAIPAGAAAGEGLNQALGITEPGVDSVLMNAALPAAGELLARSGNAAASFLGKRMPGASSTLHEMAAADLGKIPGAFRPTATADQLYSVVNTFNPKIPMTNLQRVSGELLSKEQQAAAGLKLPNASKTAESLGEMAGADPAGMSFQDVRVNLRRLGDKIRETRETGGEEHGFYKAAYRAAMDDLDAAATGGNPAQPAVQALKAANAAAKREFAADDLSDLFSIKGGGISPRPDGAGVQVNFGKIVRTIEKSDDLKRSLSPDEYDKLIKDVRDMWSNTPNLPAVAGQDAGSKLRNRSIAVGGAAGSAGAYAFGFNPALGLGIGGAAGAVLPDTIGKLMVSEGGRAFLRGVLRGTGGVISPATLGILATAVGNTSPARDPAVKLSEMGRQFLTSEGQP